MDSGASIPHPVTLELKHLTIQCVAFCKLIPASNVVGLCCTPSMFKLKVGLHQGSALSPFLIAMVMDRLTEEVKLESPGQVLRTNSAEQQSVEKR